MSLARALTTATKRMRPAQESSTPSYSDSPTRAVGPRREHGVYEPIDRSQISLPIELLSTTNPLAYDAPDLKDINIRDFQRLAPSLQSPLPSSAASYNSEIDSIGHSSALSSASSLTSPSISREASPTVTERANYFPEPTFIASVSPARRKNHNPSAPAPRKGNASTPLPFAIPDEPVPEIPKRALSHTKETHEVLARKRSSSRVRSPPTRDGSGPDTNPPLPKPLDLGNQNPAIEAAAHPFGAELAQVNELVEEMASPARVDYDPTTDGQTALAAPIHPAIENSTTPRSHSRTGRSPNRKARPAAPPLKPANAHAEVRIHDDEEERWMSERGLCRFDAVDYLAEIEGLYAGRWDGAVRGGWF